MMFMYLPAPSHRLIAVPFAFTGGVLLIPTLIYGPFRDVKSRCKRAATRLAAGVSLSEALGTDSLTDTNTVSGLLMLRGPSSLLGGESHFHCYYPLLLLDEAVLDGKMTEAAEDRILDEALETPWGTLCVIATECLLWNNSRSRSERLLRAVLHHWAELNSEGARYTTGSRQPGNLSAHPTAIGDALAHLGASIADINTAEQSDTVVGLIEHVISR